jgi:hypothetical protein
LSSSFLATWLTLLFSPSIKPFFFTAPIPSHFLQYHFFPLFTRFSYFRTCSISEASKAVVKQLGYCRGNFSLCKKFEDDGLVAISACSESTADLLAKAKALTASKTGLTAAKTAASTLSGSSSGRRMARATATTCAEVVSKITALLKAVGENPASSMVATLAGEVTGVTVTCTETEKTSLKGQVGDIW